jgi:hypothetical protein
MSWDSLKGTYMHCSVCKKITVWLNDFNFCCLNYCGFFFYLHFLLFDIFFIFSLQFCCLPTYWSVKIIIEWWVKYIDWIFVYFYGNILLFWICIKENIVLVQILETRSFSFCWITSTQHCRRQALA